VSGPTPCAATVNPEPVAAGVTATYLHGGWHVRCTCGFEVSSLSSAEAADDTVEWHHGRPSLLGGDLS
jgi:hypothetical protein